MKKNTMKLIAALAVAVFSFQSVGFAAWDKTKPRDTEKLIDSPALIRANWQAIETGTDSNLLITNAKVSNSAAIVDTKLAQITTASKVSGAAITALASIPSGSTDLAMNNGGTSANLTAVNGGIVYSGASAMAISSAGSSGQILRSGGAGAPTWSTATYPSTAGTSGNILTSDGTNWASTAPSNSASQAEMEAASSTSVNVTPGRQKYHPLMPKAVCSFNGTGTPAMIFNSGFSSTITDNGEGDWTLTLSTAMSSTNFAITTGYNRDDSYGTMGITAVIVDASTIRIYATNSVDAKRDPKFITVAVWGDI